MKTILTIGYQHYVLSAKANVNTILQALNAAVPVEDKWVEGECFYIPEKAATIGVKLVDDHFVIDPKKRKQLPLKSSAEDLSE